MNENIGLNAGKIWKYLNEKGETKIIKLKKELDLTSEEAYLALGWLAREGNVVFNKKGLSLLVKLS